MMDKYTVYDFASAFTRIQHETGCTTQQALASFLGLKQSSIADAKKRKGIPERWLLTLLKKLQLNPDWVLYGQGAKHLVPSDASVPAPQVIRMIEVRPPEKCSSQDLFGELVRRALHRPDDQAIQKEIAASWLPVKKDNNV